MLNAAKKSEDTRTSNSRESYARKQDELATPQNFESMECFVAVETLRAMRSNNSISEKQFDLGRDLIFQVPTRIPFPPRTDLQKFKFLVQFGRVLRSCFVGGGIPRSYAAFNRD